MSHSDHLSQDVRAKAPAPCDLAEADVPPPTLLEQSASRTGKAESAMHGLIEQPVVPIPTDKQAPIETTAVDSKPNEPDLAPTTESDVSPERTLWYVEKLFTYTNQLIERTQARSNYLIFANSVAAAASFTAMNSLLANRGQADYFVSKQIAILLPLLPTSIFLCSLVTAVLAFLPKIYEYEIEMNQTFITRMSAEEYRKFVTAKTDDSKLGDFIDEIHVLSRILNDKNKLVGASSKLFLFSILTIPVVVALIMI